MSRFALTFIVSADPGHVRIRIRLHPWIMRLVEPGLLVSHS